MRNALIAFALIALLPVQASALSTDEILALVAMPLAVAAVSDVAGVPESELRDLLAMLNNADVPPVQFVEVIRFVPVALVAESERPAFVQFVRTQSEAGVRGPALVTVIEQRLRTIEPTIVVAQPATRTIVVDDTFIPTVVRTRVAKVRPIERELDLAVPPGVVVVQQPPPVVVARVDRDDDDDDDDDRKGRRSKGHDKGDKGKGKGKSKGRDN